MRPGHGGADAGTRTPNLPLTRRTLCQLSYAGMCSHRRRPTRHAPAEVDSVTASAPPVASPDAPSREPAPWRG